jgi:hypothetical protein
MRATSPHDRVRIIATANPIAEIGNRRPSLAQLSTDAYIGDMNWSGMRQVPGPGQLEADTVREQQHDLEATAEHERLVEAAVPGRHRIRKLFSRLRRRH